MFTVYKITNEINGKCYIGSSIKVEIRWREHKNCAFNPNSDCYEYPLYRAFRKYGIENFTFEVLRDNFNTIKEMTDYEHDMIVYYDSYENGYNQTLMTARADIARENCSNYIKRISQACALVDNHNNIIECFPSYHAAAQKYFQGDSRYTASRVRKVCKGNVRSDNGYIFRDLDENGKVIIPNFQTKTRRKPLICIPLDNPDEEIYYDSILDAANNLTGGNRRQIQFHLHGSKRFSTVRNCLLREIDEDGNIIENAIPIEEKIIEYNRLNPEINGERHTITDWCKIYNITKQTYYYRIKQGMTPVEAITLQKRR